MSFCGMPWMVGTFLYMESLKCEFEEFGSGCNEMVLLSASYHLCVSLLRMHL